MPFSGYSLTYILDFSYLLLYGNELFKKPLCLQTACWDTYTQILSPLQRSFCCLQPWILPPAVKFIFLYAMRTMKCPWGKICGSSEDSGASALPNPRPFQHARFIARMLWCWPRSKRFCECPGTIVVLCLERYN